MYRFLRWFISIVYAVALTAVTLTYASTGFLYARNLPVWLLTLTSMYAVLMGVIFVAQRRSPRASRRSKHAVGEGRPPPGTDGAPT